MEKHVNLKSKHLFFVKKWGTWLFFFFFILFHLIYRLDAKWIELRLTVRSEFWSVLSFSHNLDHSFRHLHVREQGGRGSECSSSLHLSWVEFPLALREGWDRNQRGLLLQRSAFMLVKTSTSYRMTSLLRRSGDCLHHGFFSGLILKAFACNVRSVSSRLRDLTCQSSHSSVVL